MVSSNNLNFDAQCRRFAGKVALVTASTAGIGLAIARRLGKEGASVVVCSRRAANVETTVAALRAEGLQVAGTTCHVGDRAQLASLVRFAAETYGRLDVLVRWVFPSLSFRCNDSWRTLPGN
jgi:dehydrogenase/reductase SDR family member 4